MIIAMSILGFWALIAVGVSACFVAALAVRDCIARRRHLDEWHAWDRARDVTGRLR